MLHILTSCVDVQNIPGSAVRFSGGVLMHNDTWTGLFVCQCPLPMSSGGHRSGETL